MRTKQNSNKTIMHIVEAFGGGVFSYLSALCHEFPDYSIHIVFSRREETPSDFEQYFPSNVQFHELSEMNRTLNLFSDLSVIFKLQKLSRQIQPDYIHLHSSKAGAFGRIAFAGRKQKLFYTPHGYSFLMKTVHPVYRFTFWLAEFILGKTNCTTIGCSKSEYLESRILARHSDYVNNAIDTSSFPDSESALSGEISRNQTRPVIYTVGRICYQKNPEFFNHIAELLPDYQFVWIGDGELRDRLSAPNIRISGWKERKEVFEEASNYQIFLITSLWEGLPIALLEAMYMGKTCIVNKIPGCFDVIADGENGFICSSPEDFAQRITEASDDKKEMGKQAHSDVLRLYSLKEMGRNYRKIYERS